ncbi:MAG: ATP-dependent DNA helicase RecG [Bdellovibrionales bacterium RIFOXYD1_FULL_53_11]|nr:MAG: ATP-dependent DNA helicase RecG [Bdellovibrionales bacterium RIFOXYD1_FULL_53_11]
MTSNPQGGLDTPVQFIKGVGPRIASVFASRDIKTVRDLLTFFPRAYEDRTKINNTKDLREGMTATLSLQITGTRKIPLRNGRHLFEARCTDGAGTVSLKWFNMPRGMEARLIRGMQLIATGTVKYYQGRPEIGHPEITWNAAADALEGESRDFGRVVPVYTEIEGLPSRLLRKILWEAVNRYCGQLQEDLPPSLLGSRALPPLGEAIRAIHFPPPGEESSVKELVRFNTPAHHRMIYEEFFKFEYLVLRKRLRMEKAAAEPLGRAQGLSALDELAAALPFELTRGQRTAIKEIMDDIGSPHPMNRLIQGDVGCGKTAVALLTAAGVIAEGAQVALMAPTEILAEQHHANALKLFGGRVPALLLTGRTAQSERDKIQARLGSGEPLLLIGTHALIEDPVVFKNLAYIIIDEQHRFGVEQRRILRLKGMRKSGQKTLHAHTLVMTATPIPRTLALTVYGDLSVSTITEMPPGRSPVLTKVVRGDARVQAYEKIRSEIRAGRQAYFICPLVSDSEAEGFEHLKSAETEAERLAKEVFCEFKVGLLHGRMRADEKNSVMEGFYGGGTQILVSTTVVEVGVDVPNATVMAIEHAERFGLSQLHQLRGRVGRGGWQSYCFLFAPRRTSDTGEVRLEVLEESHDGFRIAEADLEIRGPGEFLGTRQAGDLPFKIAQLVRDREWLMRARNDAHQILKTDPDLELPEHASLKSYFLREGGAQFERLKTS